MGVVSGGRRAEFVVTRRGPVADEVLPAGSDERVIGSHGHHCLQARAPVRDAGVHGGVVETTKCMCYERNAGVCMIDDVLDLVVPVDRHRRDQYGTDARDPYVATANSIQLGS